MEVRRGDGSVIAVEVAGDKRGAPVLLCHGLADSRLLAHLFSQAALELGLRIMALDRPGVGGTDPRRLGRLAPSLSVCRRSSTYRMSRSCPWRRRHARPHREHPTQDIPADCARDAAR